MMVFIHAYACICLSRSIHVVSSGHQSSKHLSYQDCLTERLQANTYMLSWYDSSRLLVLQLQAMSEESAEPVDLKSVKTVPLKDRVQCDCCAAAIADVYLTCSNEQCSDYDLCIKCSLDARKQDKVQKENS